MGMLFFRRQVLRALSLALGSSSVLRRTALIAAESAPSQGGSPSTAVSGQLGPAGEKTGMEKVTGIGGFFFRAHDPAALASWYQQHLGISLIPSNYHEKPWQQEAGPTAFAPFPETSDYFGDARKVWMLNFRVRDLEKICTQLRAAGIEVKIDPKSYPNGRFAHLHDPEGNPIELWQPAG
jgi:glyoxylase I family protein